MTEQIASQAADNSSPDVCTALRDLLTYTESLIEAGIVETLGETEIIGHCEAARAALRKATGEMTR